jgi:hypothetical protein
MVRLLSFVTPGAAAGLSRSEKFAVTCLTVVYPPVRGGTAGRASNGALRG